ncbi:hypothetical protein [Psychrosphaera algicola]|uniref:Uncharacterized protein n=1 Tax=Psychrosphaera algicola TaxID=3023714 RepID=A0ABT5FCE5_9GAMM|nr:hypothetical protein [Psychrosphaera sp. G1-22]MDC2888262.1 hypothetical protein [Psychrosphaera sp. G1-22]
MMNIWVMNADGTEPMQISKETANTIHTPTWSHDGQYIAATRGVMSSRSIAAGEIWIYHHTGGSGSKIKAGSHGAFNQKILPTPNFLQMVNIFIIRKMLLAAEFGSTTKIRH